MRHTAQLASYAAALGAGWLSVCMLGCAAIAGLDDLEVAQPGEDASGMGGAGQDAASSAEAAGVGGNEAGEPDSADGSAGTASEAGGPPADAADAAEENSSQSCGDSQKLCEGQCVMLNDPQTGCASQGCEPCSIPHAVAQCEGPSGACSLFSCLAPYTDCDHVAANGCESNLNTDPDNCGACGHPCVTPTGVCNEGMCESTILCDLGTANCDANPGNGCETNTNTSVNDCGYCDHVCMLPYAIPTCASGVCAILACTKLHADCDNDVSTGCEVDLSSDPENCGSCGGVCAPNAKCTNGVCSQ